MVESPGHRGVAARVDEYAVHVGELYPADSVVAPPADETPWTTEQFALVREYVCAALDNAGRDPRGVAFGRQASVLVIRFARYRDRGTACVMVAAEPDPDALRHHGQPLAPGVAWQALEALIDESDEGEQRFMAGLGRELARMRPDYRAVVWPELDAAASAGSRNGAPRTPPGTRIGFELRPPRALRDRLLPPESIRWLHGQRALRDLVGRWVDYYGALEIQPDGSWTWTSAASADKVTRGVLRHEPDGRVGFATTEQGGWFWGDMALRPARTDTRLLLRYPGHAVVKQLVRDEVRRQRLLITNDAGDAVDAQLYWEPDGRYVHGRFWSLPDSGCRFLACSGTAPVWSEEAGRVQLWTRSGEVCLCSAKLELAPDVLADAPTTGRYESTNCSQERRSGTLTTRPLEPFEDIGTTLWW